VLQIAEGMNEQSSLSEILFFGMRLKAGREEVYAIENEEGQMEICHLTNCALVSDSTSKKPIYVRMKNPDVDSEFVIGALVPGQVYSFQTDLLIAPDTKFSHSGGPGDEVHLTGYRCVSFFLGPCITGCCTMRSLQIWCNSTLSGFFII
jgi:hypothetical protein